MEFISGGIVVIHNRLKLIIYELNRMLNQQTKLFVV